MVPENLIFKADNLLKVKVVTECDYMNYDPSVGLHYSPYDYGAMLAMHNGDVMYDQTNQTHVMRDHSAEMHKWHNKKSEAISAALDDICKADNNNDNDDDDGDEEKDEQMEEVKKEEQKGKVYGQDLGAKSLSTVVDDIIKAAPKGVDEAKYKRCKEQVKQQSSSVNEYAVCAASLQGKINRSVDSALDDLVKAGEGSRGGKIIGHTRSGKAIYASPGNANHNDFTSADHADASAVHDYRFKTGQAKDSALDHSNTHGRGAKDEIKNIEGEGDGNTKRDRVLAHGKKVSEGEFKGKDPGERTSRKRAEVGSAAHARMQRMDPSYFSKSVENRFNLMKAGSADYSKHQKYDSKMGEGDSSEHAQHHKMLHDWYMREEMGKSQASLTTYGKNSYTVNINKIDPKRTGDKKEAAA